MRLAKFDFEVGILHDLYQNSNLKYGTNFYKVLILSYEPPKELKFVGGMDIVIVNTVPWGKTGSIMPIRSYPDRKAESGDFQRTIGDSQTFIGQRDTLCDGYRVRKLKP